METENAEKTHKLKEKERKKQERADRAFVRWFAFSPFCRKNFKGIRALQKAQCSRKV